jgi:hypothetical protein
MNGTLNSNSSNSATVEAMEIRRSGRQKKLNYSNFNSDYMIEEALRQREVNENGFAKSRDHSEDDEDQSFAQIDPRHR